MDWDDLRYFLEVSRAGGLSEAARRLGVSPSTVSRRIQSLEAALEAKLFTRLSDGYELTEAGAALSPLAEEAEESMLWLRRGFSGGGGSAAGVVRLAAPELLGQNVIVPGMRGLLERHPEIRLEILTSVEPVRLTKREADLVIRLVRPRDGPYRVQRLGAVRIRLYASADYIARRGAPATIDDLARHDLICWDARLQSIALAQWFREILPDARPKLSLDTLQAQLAAATSGLGVAVLPDFAAIEAGLCAVLEDIEPLTLDIWLLKHEHTLELERVRLVSEHIEALLRDRARMADRRAEERAGD